MARRSKGGWLIVGCLVIGWMVLGDDDDDGPVSPSSNSTPAGTPRGQQSPTAAQSDAWLYTMGRVNVRASPSTDAPIITTVDVGTKVRVYGYEGEWWRVSNGWMNRRYLSSSPPQPVSPPRLTAREMPRPAPQQSRAGEPLRAPYVGTCDCPYDLKRNGARCGGTSAYSRPGGRSPQCYH